MKLSRYSRRLHDPWGNKHGNRFGSICRYGWMIGQSELRNPVRNVVNGTSVDLYVYNADHVTVIEQVSRSFIRAKHSFDRLRR